MGVADLNRVRYGGLDFTTNFDDILGRMQANFASDFNDYVLSSQGIMLIDVVAFGLDTLGFYLDRRASDLYLSTARTRRSVSLLCRQLGYKMGAAVAPTVDVEVALTTTYVVNMTVPKGFRFKGPRSLIFEAARDTVFLAGSGPTNKKLIPCYEGETIVETFVANGTPNQLYELRRLPSGKFIVKGSATITVDGTPFPEKDFLEIGNTAQAEIGYNDDPPTLRFGDSVFGSAPAQSAQIVISYVASSGKAGKVTSGDITGVVSPGLVVASIQIPLTVNNPKASLGGDDPESLDKAKQNAGRVFKTRQVAVTAQDYESLAGAFSDPLNGRVSIAKAFSSRSASTDLNLLNLLDVISDAAALPVPAVTASILSARAHMDAIEGFAGTVQTGLLAVAAEATLADGDLIDGLTQARAGRARTSDITADVTTGIAAVTAIATAGADQLTVGTKATLNGYFTLINSAALTTQGNIDAAIAEMESAKGHLATIGLSVATTGTELNDADVAAQALLAELGTSGPDTALRADITAIETAVTDQTLTVEEAITDIQEHQDRVLSADCRSNLVTVSILGEDASGFYAAPSSGLIQKAQEFLEARKEVTHTVSVVSGENYFIPAVIVIRLGVRTGISEALAKATIEAEVDNLLRKRAFGASLYLSEIYQVLRRVNGLVFSNAAISGFTNPDTLLLDPTKQDADGNLIILASEVVTKGTVTVSTETVVV